MVKFIIGGVVAVICVVVWIKYKKQIKEQVNKLISKIKKK